MAITKPDLERIAKYILDGLSEDEACVLCDLDKKELHLLKEQNEDVRNYFEKMAVKFKQVHLEEIAKTKSEKNSMWLLEKLRPDEFGSKQKTNPTTVNIVKTIINQIQNGEQHSRLSPRSRGDITEEFHQDDGILAIESALR